MPNVYDLQPDSDRLAKTLDQKLHTININYMITNFYVSTKTIQFYVQFLPMN